jgi:hypothetical protein
MGQDELKFLEAVAAFDRANSADPNVETVRGEVVPKELAYARRMSAWLDRVGPDASEPLRLAARCQHICRWKRPRSDYPMTRAGYHRWRTALYQFHADVAGEILRSVGYDENTIARVGTLLKKQHLKTDPEAQMLEDVICLVFLEFYFADFAPKHDDEKVIGILRKTWKKMSPIGQAEAVQLPLTDAAADLVQRALATPP